MATIRRQLVSGYCFWHARWRRLCMFFQSRRRHELWSEIALHASAQRHRTILWRSWRMRDIHRELGTLPYGSHFDRLIVRSPQEYRQRLKKLDQLVISLLAEIRREEAESA